MIRSPVKCPGFCRLKDPFIFVKAQPVDTDLIVRDLHKVEIIRLSAHARRQAGPRMQLDRRGAAGFDGKILCVPRV